MRLDHLQHIVVNPEEIEVKVAVPSAAYACAGSEKIFKVLKYASTPVGMIHKINTFVSVGSCQHVFH